MIYCKPIVQLKRRLFNWRGDGVHSPFAFNMIRNVIRNPHPYCAFSRLYRTDQAKLIQQKVNRNELWTKPKHLELIFRIVHEHKAHAIYFDSEELSLLPRYLRATGYGTPCSSLREADTIIIENTIPQDIIISPDQTKRLCLILNTGNTEVQNWSRKICKKLSPPIVFKIIDLEIWFWREATTSGVYPVYY